MLELLSWSLPTPVQSSSLQETWDLRLIWLPRNLYNLGQTYKTGMDFGFYFCYFFSVEFVLCPRWPQDQLHSLFNENQMELSL